MTGGQGTEVRDQGSVQVRDLDIADIRRLKVEPGETLVVTTARPITTLHADRLCQALKLNLPPGVRIIVLDSGMTLQVVPGVDTPPGVRAGGALAHATGFPPGAVPGGPFVEPAAAPVCEDPVRLRGLPSELRAFRATPESEVARRHEGRREGHEGEPGGGGDAPPTDSSGGGI